MYLWWWVHIYMALITWHICTVQLWFTKSSSRSIHVLLVDIFINWINECSMLCSILVWKKSYSNVCRPNGWAAVIGISCYLSCLSGHHYIYCEHTSLYLVCMQSTVCSENLFAVYTTMYWWVGRQQSLLPVDHVTHLRRQVLIIHVFRLI